MKLKGPKEKEPGFEMAPMVDVVFLLIVFFMTVANFITQERVEIDMPIADQAAVSREITNRSFISITADGDIFAGAQPTTLEEITRVARVFYQNDPDFRMIIRGDQNVEHRLVREVMNAIAAAGVDNIVFSSFQSDV